MRTFKTRRLGLLAAVAVASAACAQVSFVPPWPSQHPSAGCATGRFASVKNPTTGDVDVWVDRNIQGYKSPKKLGTVSAETTSEFELSVDDGNTLQFEWAQGAGAHASRELSQVRYQIRCQSQR